MTTFTTRDIGLLLGALTTAASRHKSQALAGHRASYHQRMASAMCELGSKLLAIKVKPYAYGPGDGVQTVEPHTSPKRATAEGVRPRRPKRRPGRQHRKKRR